MKSLLNSLLIIMILTFSFGAKSQTPCNLIGSFNAVDTLNCTTIFHPDYQDTNYIYSWDFGDGNTSNSAIAVNQYANPGTYTVTIVVSDSTCSDTISQVITVPPCTPPCPTYAVFYKTDSVCDTHFHPYIVDSSFTYSWDFGDGNTSSLIEPIHTYSAQGLYPVTLVVTQGNCTATFTDSIQSPNCNNTPCPINANFYHYDSLCYTGFYPTPLDSNLNYSWDFGDGNSSNLMVPEHLYASQGYYSVKLIISAGSCSDTIIQTAYSAPPCNS
ncbi:PKD domain-containing protein, partial [Brumimicrobium mesophilum]|uniref:PKD domain-containing protein n=1 Tax=Brumimicrobium mesophilum TaxID=392717 RepID=UPI00131DE9E1